MDIRRGHRLVIGRSLVSAIRLIGLSVPMIGCITRGHPRSDTKKDRQTNEWEEIWIYEDLPTCCTLFLFFLRMYGLWIYGIFCAFLLSNRDLTMPCRSNAKTDKWEGILCYLIAIYTVIPPYYCSHLPGSFWLHTKSDDCVSCEAISAELKLAYSKQTSLVSRNEKSTTGVVSLFKSSMRSSSSQTAQTNIYNMQCLD